MLASWEGAVMLDDEATSCVWCVKAVYILTNAQFDPSHVADVYSEITVILYSCDDTCSRSKCLYHDVAYNECIHQEKSTLLPSTIRPRE